MPAGTDEINNQFAIEQREGTTWYFHGHMPVLQHAVQDLQSFPMFTSQMIVNARGGARLPAFLRRRALCPDRLGDDGGYEAIYADALDFRLSG